jgi:NAD(P)-dependent dehydrogenase (short-subunit alcohol dehydrogenase family)
LEGQIVVVTGGGRGIGRAIALALAAAGAYTVVLARSQSELAETVAMIQNSRGRAQAFSADVADAEAVRTTMATIERSLGPVNLLVNNAATHGPIGPFCETDVDEWWQALEVNLRGPILCSRAVLPGMIARHGGRIVNIASSSFPIAYFSSYAASKTALIRFTETTAAELGPHGVSMF